jgi:hypothetical protein
MLPVAGYIIYRENSLINPRQYRYICHTLPEKQRSKRWRYSECCLWQGILFAGHDICDKRENGANKAPTIVSACLKGKRTMAWFKSLEQPECPNNNTPRYCQQFP